jgi:hypothetical protein
MARGKTLVKMSAVERATRGLLAAATAAGITGDIEVDIANGIVKFHPTGENGAAVATKGDTNEWDSVR